ncbi:MAG: protein-disulfide reductase DsbD domain-containing protein [Verrucomicrobiota bacterium]
MRKPTLLLAILLPLAQLLGAVRTKVDLVAVSDAAPGAKAMVALRMKCEPHWHVYWKNPGDAGESPTVEWKDKAGLTPGDFIWPGPKMLDQAGVYNFVYEDETLILIPVEIPAGAKGKVTLKGHVSWLECDDKGCVPQEKDVSLTLDLDGPDAVVPHDPKLYPDLRPPLRTTAGAKGDLLTVKLPSPSLTGTWFPHANFITPTATFQQKHADGKVTFSTKEATEKIADAKAVFTTRQPDGTFVNVEAALESAAAPAPAAGKSHAGTPGEWLPWSPEAQARALAEGKIVYVDFTARWCATCQVNKRVYGQSEVQRAFAAHEVVLMKADWTKKDDAIAAELKKYGRQGIPLNVALRAGAPPAVLSEVLTGGEVASAIDAVAAGKAHVAVVETHPVAYWMALGFLGGALLNLMPCVFPMIGLKVFSFAKDAAADRRTAVTNAVLYSLGVVVSFMALGALIVALKTGGASVGWGFQMQSSGFVLGTCVLMLTLGLSFSGVFEVGAAFAGNVAGAVQGGANSFFSGVLATAVATPCTAPGLGAALGFALDQERSGLETVLFFLVIGTGMALPYLLLAVFPALSSKLPKPGEWMESLKQGMSFPLFAYALYLLWVLNGLVEDAEWVRDASVGLAVIAAACWLYGRWAAPHREDRERMVGKGVAAALYLGTLTYLFITLP